MGASKLIEEVHMFKGCQRNIYHIKKTNSALFDEVFFVLKKRVSNEYIPGIRHINDTEMAEEAEKIISEVCRGCAGKPLSRFRKMSHAGAFILGAVSSSAVIGALTLVLVFL